MNLTVKMMLGMASGVLTGLTFHFFELNTEGGWVQEYLTGGIFTVVGMLFVNALKMMVVPLVLFSVVCGVCGMGNLKLLGKIGGKCCGLYLVTTASAVLCALLVAAGLGIGEGSAISSSTSFSEQEVPPLSEVFINIVPTNLVQALVQGQVLSIIFFAVLFGAGLLLVGQKARPLMNLFDVVNEVLMNMVALLMNTAPYAVFCLLANAVAGLGMDLLRQLMAYMLATAGVLLFHQYVFMPVFLKALSGLSPRTYLKKMRNVQLFAFSTASSSATMPVTLATMRNQMGVDNSVTSFSVPLGATINMDGTAIMQVTATVFIANIYGIELGLSAYVAVVVMSILASISTVGVPGAGLIMLSMVLLQVGLPLEGIGLILGVDRIIDMMRTVVNVSTDVVVGLVVAKSEKLLDEHTFNSLEVDGIATSGLEPGREAGADGAQVIPIAKQPGAWLFRGN